MTHIGLHHTPNGGDVEEDRGSDGNNGTPDDSGSGEERDEEARFPLRLSIRWTPPSTCTGDGWKRGGGGTT